MRVRIGLGDLLGIANSFIAELWALRDGLLLCQQLNVQAIIIELDAKAIVYAFNLQANSNTVVSSIMDDYRHLVTHIPQTSIRHVFREANRSADWLANLGLNLDYDFKLFSSLLVDLISCLEADCHALFCNRPCFEPVFAFQFLMKFPFLPKKNIFI